MTGRYGKYSPVHEYLATAKGHWAALPSSTGTLNLTCAGRISLLKQYDGMSRHRWFRSGLTPAIPTRQRTRFSAAAQGVSAMIRSSRVTRRRALELSAAAAALPLVHIRTAGAAGKLNVGFWDHWVPQTNEVMTKQVNTWAEKNKVDVTIDFITLNGFEI